MCFQSLIWGVSVGVLGLSLGLLLYLETTDPGGPGGF